MSEGLNQVNLLGNLGADPELRFGPNGSGVLKLRLATSRSWFDRELNARKESTEWHSVVLFGKRAEALSRILVKGSRIMVVGSLRTNSWTDTSGEKKYRTEVIAQEVLFAGGTSRLGENRAPSAYGGETFQGEPPGDDDIPF